MGGEREMREVKIISVIKCTQKYISVTKSRQVGGGGGDEGSKAGR